MYSEFGFVIASTLALSIGANNAGISMGPVYGAGARSRWASLVLIAIFYFAGAVLLGPRGIRTVGSGIFTADLSSNPYLFLLVAPAAALVLLTLATLLKVPVSTTHAAVAALAGVGLFLDVLNAEKTRAILAWWIATPIVAFAVTYPIARLVPHRWSDAMPKRAIGFLLTLGGCYMAFTVGANNAANATGALAGAGLVSPLGGAAISGLGMAVGGLLWGGRMLEAVGKKLTELNHLRSLVVALVSGTITLVAALYGIPISKTLVVASAIIAYGLASNGVRETYRNGQVRRIAVLWTTSPLIAVGSTYALVWALRVAR